VNVTGMFISLSIFALFVGLLTEYIQTLCLVVRTTQPPKHPSSGSFVASKSSVGRCLCVWRYVLHLSPPSFSSNDLLSFFSAHLPSITLATSIRRPLSSTTPFQIRIPHSLRALSVLQIAARRAETAKKQSSRLFPILARTLQTNSASPFRRLLRRRRKEKNPLTPRRSSLLPLLRSICVTLPLPSWKMSMRRGFL
jgi:hypothetical protein